VDDCLGICGGMAAIGDNGDCCVLKERGCDGKCYSNKSRLQGYLNGCPGQCLSPNQNCTSRPSFLPTKIPTFNPTPVFPFKTTYGYTTTDNTPSFFSTSNDLIQKLTTLLQTNVTIVEMTSTFLILGTSVSIPITMDSTIEELLRTWFIMGAYRKTLAPTFEDQPDPEKIDLPLILWILMTMSILLLLLFFTGYLGGKHHEAVSSETKDAEAVSSETKDAAVFPGYLGAPPRQDDALLPRRAPSNEDAPPEAAVHLPVHFL